MPGSPDALGMFLIFGLLFLVLLLVVSGVEYAGRRLWAWFGNGGGSGRSTT